MGLIVLLAGVGLVAIVFVARRPAEPLERRTETSPRPQPSVYCEFYDFMRASVVVSYDFAGPAKEPTPRLVQRAEVDAEKARVTFDDQDRPVWTSALEDGVLASTSPDGETKILFFGLKLGAPGVFWGEAGLRSVRFRNLEGKCRQAHLDLAGK